VQLAAFALLLAGVDDICDAGRVAAGFLCRLEAGGMHEAAVLYGEAVEGDAVGNRATAEAA
jgi:hypothetical protein